MNEEDDNSTHTKDDIRVHHEAMRREMWLRVFSHRAPFTTVREVHNASKLATCAVLDFDEFFRKHP